VKARRPLPMGVLVAMAIAGLWSSSGTSWAANPIVDECVNANEEAQDLRSAGALLRARERLAVCIAPRCPGPVRDDCAARLHALEEATPTLVFAGTEGAGSDAHRIPVSLDGRPLPAKVPTAPIPVDPGAHQIVFESDGHTSETLTIVVREGEKDRLVTVPAASPERLDFQRPVGLVIGGVGLASLVLGSIFAALAKSTDAHALSDECGGNPNACSPAGVRDGERAHAQAQASTLALIGGGVLLSAGAVVYFTAPRGHRVSLGASGGAGRAGLSLSGAF
jgi:hypothetical protein